MTRTAPSVSLLACLLLCSPAFALQPPGGGDAAAPTPEDVKAAYERKDYKETLRLVGRVLSFKGRAAEGVDRHENIGEGHMGLGAFESILAHPAFREVPFFLEVPGFDNDGPDARNIEILRTVAERAGVL